MVTIFVVDSSLMPLSMQELLVSSRIGHFAPTSLSLLTTISKGCLFYYRTFVCLESTTCSKPGK